MILGTMVEEGCLGTPRLDAVNRHNIDEIQEQNDLKTRMNINCNHLVMAFDKA